MDNKYIVYVIWSAIHYVLIEYILLKFSCFVVLKTYLTEQVMLYKLKRKQKYKLFLIM